MIKAHADDQWIDVAIAALTVELAANPPSEEEQASVSTLNSSVLRRET